MSDSGSSSQLITVAKVGDIAPGRAISVQVEGRPVAIFNIDGNYHAIVDQCTHAGAALSTSELNGTIVTCQYHGAQFDVTTGKALSEPARVDTPSFPVHVVGDEIKLEIG